MRVGRKRGVAVLKLGKDPTLPISAALLAWRSGWGGVGVSRREEEQVANNCH